MKLKTFSKFGAGALLIAGAYYGAVEYWVWKWESPHLPLPAKHLAQSDFVSHHQPTEKLAHKAQAQMRTLAEELQSVSMSGAMAINGDVIWSGAVGLASVEPLRKATVNTQYRIGSVSKPLTAVALMRMVEEQMADIDAPLQDYLPHYPRYDADVTMRQLVSHMAGVRHYHFDMFKFPPTDAFSNVAYVDANAALAQFKDDDLLFTPGQGFKYSTHGYTLLSAAMQAAGNKQFEKLVEEMVIQPLGLNQTRPEHLLKDTNHLATFYTSDDGLYGETPKQNLSNKVAGGGYISTPTDLVKLGDALLSNRLLTADSFQKMTEVQPMFDGSDNPQYYALGWRHYETSHIIDEDNKVDVIHHGGRAQGADTFLLLVPEHKITVAITTNGQGNKSRGEIQMLAYRMAGLAIAEKSEETLLTKK